jgi:patatin-like phospholipase/acyl hydrolase
LGLSLGLPARKVAALYAERGEEIFPSQPKPPWKRWLRRGRNYLHYRYEHDGLKSVLEDTFGEHIFSEAKIPLCIPSCDGRYGEVYVFKTPHHPDFTKDGGERMVKIALSTSTAPTYFQPFDSGGYRHLDGGLWANNPIMVGLTDALSCFDVDRGKIRILSISCDDSPFVVTDKQVTAGGLLYWTKALDAAIHLQSLNAMGQASLLIGADRILRVTPGLSGIELDDYAAAMKALPTAATDKAAQLGKNIARMFLQER